MLYHSILTGFFKGGNSDLQVPFSSHDPINKLFLFIHNMI